MTKAVFFDVANTLLEKPNLYLNIHNILKKEGYNIPFEFLQTQHRLISETLTFPDKTSADFYQFFNSKFLLLLGIIPTNALLLNIYQVCSYLPWKIFPDTKILSQLFLPIGVISNWDKTLPEKLNSFFDIRFSWVLCSEEMNKRKPAIDFYENILKVTGYNAEEILYVGDSIELDIQPALNLGMKTVLIDRLDLYKYTSLNRIKDLGDIKNYL